MSTLEKIYRTLVGLFVDDGALALAILSVVLLAGILAFVTPESALQAGAILLFGCLGALVTSVFLAARR